MKIRFVVSILICFLFVGVLRAQTDSRGMAAWSVLRYDINATLPQNYTNRYLSVRANLGLKNVGTSTGSKVTLRISEKAEVSAIKVGDVAVSFQKGEEKLTATRNLQRVIVNIPTTQVNGTLSLVIDYKLKVDENSGLNALSPAGSQFLPLSFWYPTPTNYFAPRGADFAPFNLSVTGTNDQLISSGERRSKDLLFDQKLNGQPFFVTGNWDSFESKGISFFLPKGSGEFEKQRAIEIANIASEAREFYSSLLGSGAEIPWRFVAVKRGAGFSDGGTILLEYGAFRRTKLDSNSVVTILESIAKVWLGNQKIVRGEGYGVIREGLSRYLSTQFLERKFGKETADLERLRQRTSFAGVARRDAPLRISSPLDDFYYASVANKGAMVWRLVSRETGNDELFRVLRSLDSLALSEIRAALPTQKQMLDTLIDQTTDTDLLAGLPQMRNSEANVALRNLGSIDVKVNVVGLNEKGEKVATQVTVPALNFGQANLRSPSKIVLVEIDPEKYYPQTDYSNDVAPREFSESDPLLVVKRSFDKQDFVTSEKSARAVLSNVSNFDDARILLARSLFAQGNLRESEKEYRSILNEKLPSARSLAWSNVGLGEILANTNPVQASRHFDDAISCDAEYGATLAARDGRNKIDVGRSVDPSVREFFVNFDKAVLSLNKSMVESLIIPGEVNRFASGISGQSQVWETRVLHVDHVDANTVSVETVLKIRLLNRNDESGKAVFGLTRIGGAWKLNGVEMFEVR